MTTIAEQILFLRHWVVDPRRVGAIVPSGGRLASVITQEITPLHAPVIELGAGTGSFTRRLIERGVPESKLVIVEHGAGFARALKEKYPSALVLQMDAADLGGVPLFGEQEVGAVVSGLPLLSLPRRTVIRILLSAFRHLRAGGAFFQFTYGPRCPVPAAVLDRLGLRAQRVGRCLANLPPATVYRISRRQGVVARFQRGTQVHPPAP